ncbi:hypothetical protein [Bowmanella sp. JS7-9]|uniref:Uncharacterized protein n=1 Tax=Pseudobowmanella zhangzhouensis TaxID=1537679 RepID=A0ABW1XJ49_9ALTE|nr:hypothetical protein [Bowmanella sp. JS7-9]
MMRNKLLGVISGLGLFAVLTGCISTVAPYDEKGAEQIVEVAAAVDTFYADMLATPAPERVYSQWEPRYREITVALRMLVMRNQIRPMNSESIAISEQILQFFERYQQRHKDNWARYILFDDDPQKLAADAVYKDALLGNHRQRFFRLFIAMALSEEAKKSFNPQQG